VVIPLLFFDRSRGTPDSEKESGRVAHDGAKPRCVFQKGGEAKDARLACLTEKACHETWTPKDCRAHNEVVARKVTQTPQQLIEESGTKIALLGEQRRQCMQKPVIHEVRGLRAGAGCKIGQKPRRFILSCRIKCTTIVNRCGSVFEIDTWRGTSVGGLGR
jgi:hypothetical protein